MTVRLQLQVQLQVFVAIFDQFDQGRPYAAVCLLTDASSCAQTSRNGVDAIFCTPAAIPNNSKAWITSVPISGIGSNIICP